MRPGTPPALGIDYRDGVRFSITRHLATAMVLLCLQATATVMVLRRDPLERFEGAALTGLVWWSMERGRVLSPPRR